MISIYSRFKLLLSNFKISSITRVQQMRLSNRHWRPKYAFIFHIKDKNDVTDVIVDYYFFIIFLKHDFISILGFGWRVSDSVSVWWFIFSSGLVRWTLNRIFGFGSSILGPAQTNSHKSWRHILVNFKSRCGADGKITLRTISFYLLDLELLKLVQRWAKRS